MENKDRITAALLAAKLAKDALELLSVKDDLCIMLCFAQVVQSVDELGQHLKKAGVKV
jgi:hypothetical protein